MKSLPIILCLSVSVAFVSCSKKEDAKKDEPQVTQEIKLVTSPPAPINEPSELLIPTDTTYDIMRTAEPTAKKLAELAPAEKSKQFDEFSLVDMTTSTYTVQDIPLTARILRFPDEASAYGYMAVNRPALGSVLQLGSSSFAIDSVLMFSDGPYVIRITSNEMNAKTMTAQSMLAEQIAHRFGEATASPPMFLLFPFSGRVGGTNLYHPKSYLGIVGLDKVYSSDYDVSNKKAVFFITLDDSGAQFATLQEQAAKTPGTQPSATELGFKEGYAVRFVHPKAGVVVAGLVKGKLIGVAGYNADAHQRLLTGWAQGLDH